MLKELYVICEGPTEQGFCSRVLQPALFPNQDGFVSTIRVANSHKGGAVHRGGVRNYHSIKKDIQNLLKEHQRPNVFFTSLLDLYGLPADFVGKDENQLNAQYPHQYVESLEAAFGSDIDNIRFVPHLQLYEYETLLFSNIESFRYSYEDCDAQIDQLRQIVDSVPSIEHINDGKKTAPSKRIINIFPEYEFLKTTDGVDIAELTGMDVLRERCPHFNLWIERLIQLWPEESQDE